MLEESPLHYFEGDDWASNLIMNTFNKRHALAKDLIRNFEMFLKHLTCNGYCHMVI